MPEVIFLACTFFSFIVEWQKKKNFIFAYDGTSIRNRKDTVQDDLVSNFSSRTPLEKNVVYAFNKQVLLFQLRTLKKDMKRSRKPIKKVGLISY